MEASYQYLSNENKFSMWSQRNLHFIRYIEIKLYICNDIFFSFFNTWDSNQYILAFCLWIEHISRRSHYSFYTQQIKQNVVVSSVSEA